MRGLMRSPGETISDRYRIEQHLGSGGAGQTYRATDLTHQREVALKELSLMQVEEWKAVELFEREASVLANLRHPNIPAYIDHFHEEEGTRLFLVQELAPGQTIAQLIADGWRQSEEETKAFACALLDVLIYLHGLHPPVIHRDIKPHNIVRSADGTLYLVDFGSVRDKMRSTNSLAQSVVGTFGYMAPEQIQGRAGPHSDLYGLATTLVHLLSHREPSELPSEKLKLKFEPYVNISGSMTRWLQRMLEPAPEDRFESAQLAKQALMSPTALPAPADRALKSNAPGRALGRPVEKPHGSKVRLQKEGGALELEVPPLGLRLSQIPMIGFMLFWLSFVAIWTAAAWHSTLFFAAFSIPFWLVGFGLLGKIAFDILGRTQLSIGASEFEFSQTVLGIGRRRSGPTSHLKRPRVEERKVRRNYRTRSFESLALDFGVKDIRFGERLSSQEREWLQWELERYLES